MHEPYRVLERCFTANEREYLDTVAEFTKAVDEMQSLEGLDRVVILGVIVLERKHLTEAFSLDGQKKQKRAETTLTQPAS